jgi:hypothetical protein
MSTKPIDDEEMLPEYDFSQGVRGKYLGRVGPGKIITLEADVAEVFTDSEAVNDALRGLMAIIQNQAKKAQRQL